MTIGDKATTKSRSREEDKLVCSFVISSLRGCIQIDYSVLSDTIGSVRAARRAGK